ncbi:4'-phosphopantetheinyl transferase superfamily protein [Streptomyces spinosirectus]|uniref:4'-phosphopantetheinyl transferase family protein n=1 Tax=Streptomyces TaxID=1883 RepID=UPI001C9DAC58|nr:MULTISPECIES: 4'-phosphopantetheinyl transferase superfamily protein [Streptomyces]MBY8345278.1 4'-phosphopantetheinyl transferase superfamily protein [Streptomyces plumbidurans]UIR17721.1 4'-phosphopantetheinyl transferase superfamily protein [Streptomyces spinosirectus]
MTQPHGRPLPGELHVWWLPVPPGTSSGRARSVLDPAETERAGRLLRPERRHRFVLAHAGLRLLCGRYLGAAPSEVTFERAPCPLCGAGHGRPRLRDGGGLHFSMAHSGTAVLYAFSTSHVGVDVEAAPARPGLERTVGGWLHPGERQELHRLRQAERPSALLRLWVRKEAYLKGIGTGIAHGVGGPPGSYDDAWALLDLGAPGGFVAAAAVRGGAPGTLRSSSLSPSAVTMTTSP